jgi:hypothetical protein
VALFFFILRDVHCMLSVICECLVEGRAKWEKEWGTKEVTVKVSVYDLVMILIGEIRA